MNRYLVIDRAGIVHPAPTFVISAMDPAAYSVIKHYAGYYSIRDVSIEVAEMASDFEAWRHHPANAQRVAEFDPFAVPDYEDDWIKKAIEAPGAKVALYLVNKEQRR